MNKNNLLKLADYLANLRQSEWWKFDMKVFCSDGGLMGSVDCGAIGCAVGHGPYAGIPKRISESWAAYSFRVFGLDCFAGEWVYLFDAGWSDVPRRNTPKATANRIRRFVESDGEIPVNPLGITPRKGGK